MPPKLLIDLPADVVQHILLRIQLAHHIARSAPTCKVVSVAVRNAFKVRPFSREVLPDNQHALSGSFDNTVKLFNVNGGAVLRTFRHHAGNEVRCLALLPDGLRFVSGSLDKTARIVEHGLAPTPTRA